MPRGKKIYVENRGSRSMTLSEISYHLKQSKFIRVVVYPIANISRLYKRFCYRFTIDAKKMRKYKNIHVGERCFIIGNGPSLTVDDLDKLQGEHCFAANHIYKMFSQTQWRPEFFFCVDVHVLHDIRNAIEKMTLEHIFIDMWGKKYNIQRKNNNITYIYNYCPYSINPHNRTDIKMSSDVSKYFVSGATVTYAAIQMAIYMGFKEIYLLGVDHQYSKYRDEKGELKTNDGVVDHFDGEKSEDYCVQSVVTSTAAYKAAKVYCEKNDVIIKNLTRGGALEVFERAEFDEIVCKREQ